MADDRLEVSDTGDANCTHKAGLTMRLERITIANFKGLTEVQFEPTRFSCLVGENNIGNQLIRTSVKRNLTLES